MTRPVLRTILTEMTFARTLMRMVHQIAEHHAETESLVLVGVQRGGVRLAVRLAQQLSTVLTQPVLQGEIDASLHRDDLAERGAIELQPTRLPCDISGRSVILVDDVLYTGRTARAAMDALHDYGRPGRIQLAVLIDRGHRELPITGDFVGKSVSTTFDQRIRVEWSEDGGRDQVMLEGS